MAQEIFADVTEGVQISNKVLAKSNMAPVMSLESVLSMGVGKLAAIPHYFGLLLSMFYQLLLIVNQMLIYV